MQTSDFVIVGGGIVGLATAMSLQTRFPELKIVLVEAEGRVARHQSGHNSGVIHSGVYYKPGSSKATNCRSGKEAMEAFCDEHGIAWDRCGKVIVATSDDEVQQLDRISLRAEQNGVAYERIDASQLRELEPAAAGLAALHVPETGIVDYRRVSEVMSKIVIEQNGAVRLNFQVTRIDPQTNSIQLTSRDGETIQCDQLINCAGLNSDRICRMAGGDPQVKVVPFRGEYYEFVAGRESLCRNLIYPVPDPSFPFLGVHFTRMIDGGVECGPNAVLALSRAGYRWSDINIRDLSETLAYKGFRRLAAKHWRMGLGEIHRSLRKSAFVTALQKLIPSIRNEDLKPGRAGVRAQAVSPDGNLVDDFLIEKSERAIHILNAPSPAATASLAIAQQIVRQLG